MRPRRKSRVVGFQLGEYLRQIPVRCRSAYERNVRRALENPLAFLLSDTAEHSESLALRLQLLVVRQAMKNLLLGFIAYGAGIVEHQTGFFDGGDLAVSLGDERAHNLLGVMRVHLATEGFQIESLFLLGHKNQV